MTVLPASSANRRLSSVSPQLESPPSFLVPPQIHGMPLPPTDPYGMYRPQQRRTGLIIGIVVSVLVVLTGAGLGGFALARHGKNSAVKTTAVATATSAVPSAGPSATATAAPRDHTGDLRKFLLNPPSSSQPWADPPGVDNKLSIKEAASYYDNPKSATSYLRGLGFKAGAVQSWLEADGSSVEIDLYRFGTSNNAYSYFQDLVSNDLTDRPKGTVIKMIDKIPTGHGEVIGFAKKDKYGDQMSHGMGIKDDVAYEVWVYQQAPQSIPFTEAIVYKQWSKL